MKIDYRPEIDGLRALAVMAVLIYHAEFQSSAGNFLPGGLLGVDVFFVISGFIITTLLKKEWQMTGTISIRQFYIRRARRILPALLTVMLVSLPFAWHILLPTALVDFVKSLLASLGFCSNLYWLYSLQEYGAESGLLKPFLHTWSLAVEEQFYLIYPLLLIGCWKFLPHRVNLVLAILIVTSLGFAEGMSRTHPSASFYILPSRLWELLIGGWIALSHREVTVGRTWNFLPWIGMVMVLGSFFVQHLEVHPGLVTLAPVGGTALIIASARAGGFVIRVLGSKPMAFLGRISYSLYLWHYPVFAFARIQEHELDGQVKMLLLGLSLVLACTSYYTIEQVFRNPVRTSLPRFSILTGLGLASVVIFSVFVMQDRGSIARFPELAAIYQNNEFDNAALMRKCKVKSLEFQAQSREFSDQSETEKILIIGDSHGTDSFCAFMQNRELFKGFEFMYYWIELGASEKDFQKLFNLRAFAKAEHVMISSRFARPDADIRKGQRSSIDCLESVILETQKRGKNVIVCTNTIEFKYIEGQPVFDWYVQHPPENIYTQDDLNHFFWMHQTEGVDAINVRIREVAKRMKAVLLEKADYMSDPKKQLCSGITPDGRKVFLDYGRYTL